MVMGIVDRHHLNGLLDQHELSPGNIFAFHPEIAALKASKTYCWWVFAAYWVNSIAFYLLSINFDEFVFREVTLYC